MLVKPPLPGEHLGRERRRQVVVVHVVVVDGGKGARPNLQGVFLQHLVHLPLHALGPGEQVGLQAPSGLHQRVLPPAEARQRLQVVVQLSQDGVDGDRRWRRRRLGAAALRAVAARRGLARHVALELLRGKVERLSVQLLDEGHRAALADQKDRGDTTNI